MPLEMQPLAGTSGKMPREDRAWPAPATLVALFAATQVAVWTLAPTTTHHAPPLDVVESTMWGREWVIATYKHPALPSWVLEASRVVTGAVGWPAYLISQLFITASFAFVYLLGRDMMGPQRAAAGTLLLGGVAYYAWPTPEFNHNIAEIPFWAGLPLAVWRAVERRSLLWWALVGAFAAGGLYAKLSSGLLLIVAAGWILFDPRARRCLATPGPWLGLATFAILVAPLVSWLVANDFAPLRYAALRSTARSPLHVLLFAFDTLLNLTGMLVMLAVAGLAGPWSRAAAAGGLTQPPMAAIDERAKHFLLTFTFGPLVLAMIGAVFSHAGLKTAWGSSMFNLVGLVAVALMSRRFTPEALRRIAVSAGVLLIVVPLSYALVVSLSPRYAKTAMRVQWPQAEIADRLGAVWARETGRSLRIVSGDNWIAGLVGLTNQGQPSIFTNGDMRLSPWINPSRLEAEGMLIVWDTSTRRIPATLQPLVDAGKTGEERFKFSPRRGQPELVIGYAIVPPKQGPR